MMMNNIAHQFELRDIMSDDPLTALTRLGLYYTALLNVQLDNEFAEWNHEIKFKSAQKLNIREHD